jgi:uncharacterized protein (TIGR00725 family)
MSIENKIRIIGVIGPSEFHCPEEIYEFAYKLGKSIIDMDYFLVCGGLGGTMEAACKGAHASEKYQPGKTIGIIPGADKSKANKYCDIIIPTGLGFARNILVVNSADVVVALGGGSGTLSEIAFAWQQYRPIICYDGFKGWSAELADRKLDERRDKPIYRASSLEEIMKLIGTII